MANNYNEHLELQLQEASMTVWSFYVHCCKYKRQTAYPLQIKIMLIGKISK